MAVMHSSLPLRSSQRVCVSVGDIGLYLSACKLMSNMCIVVWNETGRGAVVLFCLIGAECGLCFEYKLWEWWGRGNRVDANISGLKAMWKEEGFHTLCASPRQSTVILSCARCGILDIGGSCKEEV